MSTPTPTRNCCASPHPSGAHLPSKAAAAAVARMCCSLVPASLNVFAHGLQKLGKTRANSDDIFTALADVYAQCQGAFACAVMIAGFGILGFR